MYTDQLYRRRISHKSLSANILGGIERPSGGWLCATSLSSPWPRYEDRMRCTAAYCEADQQSLLSPGTDYREPMSNRHERTGVGMGWEEEEEEEAGWSVIGEATCS